VVEDCFCDEELVKRFGPSRSVIVRGLFSCILTVTRCFVSLSSAFGCFIVRLEAVKGEWVSEWIGEMGEDCFYVLCRLVADCF
jgi:hypothetical protein